MSGRSAKETDPFLYGCDDFFIGFFTFGEELAVGPVPLFDRGDSSLGLVGEKRSDGFTWSGFGGLQPAIEMTFFLMEDIIDEIY